MRDNRTPKDVCGEAILKRKFPSAYKSLHKPRPSITSLLRTVSNVPTKFSYFSLKETSIISLIRTMDIKSRPQGVNSYKLNLLITDRAVIRWILNPDQVSLHRVNLVWLVSYARWHKAQDMYRLIHKLFLASSFCIITWESSHIAWVHLEILKKSYLLKNERKLRTLKSRNLMPFFHIWLLKSRK